MPSRQLRQEAHNLFQLGNIAAARLNWRNACQEYLANERPECQRPTREKTSIIRKIINLYAQGWADLVQDLEPDDCNLIIWFLGQAEHEATSVINWIECATAWKHLLNDEQNAVRCLGAAEHVAAAAEVPDRGEWHRIATSYQDILNDMASHDRCQNNALALELRAQEDEARSFSALINCAKEWHAKLNNQDAVQRCLQEAEEMIDRIANAMYPTVIDRLAEIAREWLNLAQDDQLARQCLERANAAAQDSEEYDDWLNCAGHWIQLLNDHEQCRICLNNAMDNATGTLAWIDCGKAWIDLLMDQQTSKNCYQQAQRRARTPSAYLACARVWFEVDNINATKECLLRVEQRLAGGSNNSNDWLTVGNLWHELHDDNAARRCFAQAQPQCTTPESWRECSESYTRIGEIETARICEQKAEAAVDDILFKKVVNELPPQPPLA